MWDLTSDDGRTTAHEYAETPDEKTMRWPQAYSTMLGAHGKESGYSTREIEGSILLWKLMSVSEKIWNGERNLELDRNVVERRQPKLTEKGKAYRLTERKRERNKLKREIQSRIANIGTLMGLDKNLELVGKESVKLNECFKEFTDLHEEIQELLTEQEQSLCNHILLPLEKVLTSTNSLVYNYVDVVFFRVSFHWHWQRPYFAECQHPL